jgi:multiple sugar transport system permease protein
MSAPATAIASAPAPSTGLFAALAPGGKRVFFALAAVAVCLLFAFPVFWLVLTSLRPGTGVYYVHLATVLSLGVTTTSGYMLSRFRGPIPNTWFSSIYVFRCVPYVAWVLPLYFVTQQLRIFDTYWGLLFPHVAVHICFFSWIMKGFFDGIDPSMEYAAMIDGCSRWGAFLRVALPSAVPGLTALAILCWLFTWNEFLFALILTSHETPILTVVMAQFVHELGMEWHLMSATAVIALVPALIITLFGQKYVLRGLRV